MRASFSRLIGSLRALACRALTDDSTADGCFRLPWPPRGFGAHQRKTLARQRRKAGRRRRIVLEPLEDRSLLASIVWTGVGNTSWANAANWTPNQVPTSADDVTINDVANDPVLDQSRSIGSLQGDGLIDLASFVLTIGNSASMTFSGVMSGSGGINKVGSGILTLAGQNNYTGTTRISSGTLKLAATGGIASNSPVVFENAPAVLDLSGVSRTIGSLASTGPIGGRVTNSGGPLTLTIGANNSSTSFAGVIENGSGVVSVVKTGTGKQSFVGANTYTGATTINDGTIELSVSNVLSDSTSVVVDGANATLDVSGNTDTVAQVTLVNGQLKGQGGGLTSLSTIQVQSGFVSARLGGSAGLAKTGPGTVTFAAANTYSGITEISDGIVVITDASALGAIGSGNETHIASGKLLEASSVLNVIEPLLLDGTLRISGGNCIWSGTITTAGTIEVTTGLNLEVNAPIGGTNLTKSGDGRLILISTANNYTGLTRIEAGILKLGTNGVIPNTSDVMVDGTLDMAGKNEAIDGLDGSGTVTSTAAGAITLTVGSNNGGGPFSGVIQNGIGTLALTKVGSGTQTLSGTAANTFSGLTTVQAGTLSLGKSAGINAVGGNLTIGDGSGVDTVALLASEQIPNSETVTINASGVLSQAAHDETIGTLTGLGAATTTTGKLTVATNLAPGTSPGIISTGNLILTGNYSVEINGPTAGLQHDKVVVSGTVQLSGDLIISGSGFVPVTTNVITLIDNDGSDPISGTFSNYPEGATVSVGSFVGLISYHGGSNNNDVVITGPVEVSIAATDAVASESPIDNGQFTVALTNGAVAPPGGVTVNFSLSGSTASTTGADYASIGTSVFIPAGQNSATIDVAGIVNDQLVEGSETVVVTLTSTNNPSVTIASTPNNQATVTILDNDAAALTLSGVTTATEGGAAGGLTVTLSLITDGTGTQMLATPITGIALAANAEFSSDTKSFGSGALPGDTVSVTVTAANDLVVEGPESFSASLVDATSSVPVIEGGSGTVNVADNDTALLTFTAPSSSVPENGGTTNVSVSLTITANGMTGVGTLASAVTANLTGNSAGTDYMLPAAPMVSFPAGSSSGSQTVTISIVNEAIVEANETFSLALTDVSGPAGQTAASGTHALTIENDDTASLSIGDANTIEGTGSGTTTLSFRVTLDAAVEGGFDVDFASSLITAEVGDFTVTTASPLHFNGTAGETRSIAVAINRDAVVEDHETFRLTLGNISNTSTEQDESITTGDSAIGTIENDDAASLSVDDVSVVEGTGAGTTTLTFSVELSAAVESGFDVEFSSSLLSAEAGDFTVTTTSPLHFTGTVGESRPIAVTISRDAVVEDHETFRLTLGNVTNTSTEQDDSISTGDAAIGTIENDDSATLSVGDVSVSEGTGAGTTTLTFSVTSDAAVEDGFDVDFSSSLLTAEAGDFAVITAGPLHFTGTLGEARQIAVSISRDAVVEDHETFRITLGNVSNTTTEQDDSITTGDTAIGTIENDDTVALSVADQSIVEGSGVGTTTLTFSIVLDAAVEGGFDVDFSSSLLTAEAGDFTVTTAGPVHFTGTVGETRSIAVNISRDAVVEDHETFRLTLGNVSNTTAEQDESITTGDTATGTIENDDAASLTIEDVSIVEGTDTGTTTLTFTVTLDAAVEGGFDAAFSSSLLSAEAGDFAVTTISPLHFTGALGETRPIAVNITRDAVVEDNETFRLTLGDVSNTTTEQDESIATGDAAIGTIENDDTATLSVDDVSVVEGTGAGTTTLTFNVSVDAAVEDGFDVGFASSLLSAEAGDFTVSTISPVRFSGTLGETRPIAVSISRDAIVEDNEAFLLTLGNVSNTTVEQDESIATGDSATGTIENDDTASLSVADVSMAEGTGTGTTTLTFTVTLDAAVEDGFDVDFASGLLSAEAGDFAVTTTSPLHFTGTVGETHPIAVNITRDAVVEDHETFQLTLGNVSNTTAEQDDSIATGDTAVGTILNDDTATLSIGDETIVEGTGAGTTTLTFTVTLDAAVEGGFDVAFASSLLNAEAGDFTVTTASPLHFAGTVGETHSIAVNINRDAVVEDHEMFSLTLGDVSNTTAEQDESITTGDAAVGTIENDDTAALSIEDVSVVEGTGAGTTTLTFTVTLDAAVEGGFDVAFASSLLSAEAGDFTVTTTSPIHFAGTVGETRPIAINITRDAVVEDHETFRLTLGDVSNTTAEQDESITTGDSAVGTIENDDTATLSIDDVSIAEGTGSGATTLTFTARVDAAVEGGFDVDFSSSLLTAEADDLSASTISPLHFTGLVGETQTIAVNISRDVVVEDHETFRLTLGNVSNTTLEQDESITTGDSAIGTIRNDDTAVFTIEDATVNEGDRTLTLSVALSNPIDTTVKLNVTFADVTTAAADFVHTPHQLTFAAPSTATQSFTFAILEDLAVEGTETFQASAALDASTPLGGGYLSDLTDTGNETITDNDVAAARIFNLPVAGNYRIVRNGPNLEVYRDAALLTTEPFGTYSITFNGTAGNDSLTVDLSGGDAIPGGGITFNGDLQSGLPGDSLSIIGDTTQGTTTYRYTGPHDGSVEMSNFGTVTYTGLEPIANTGIADDVIVNLPLAASNVDLKDDGSPANGLVQIFSNNGTFETTVFRNPINSLTINPGNAADTLTVSVLQSADFNASLTIGSSSDPFSAVSFTGGLSLGANKNLTAHVSGPIELTNADADLSLSGSGAVLLSSARNIVLQAGSSIANETGDITLSANLGTTPTSGDFPGIAIQSAAITSSGGSVTLTGRGGNTLGAQYGILLNQATFHAGDGESMLIEGTGGPGTGNANHGVYIPGSVQFQAGAYDVVVHGFGGGSGTGSVGVKVDSGGSLSARGASSISVEGTGGAGGGGSHGVQLTGGSINGEDGDIEIVAAAGGSFAVGNEALHLSAAGSTIATTGAGNITLTADSIELAPGSAINAGANTVTVRQRSNDTHIDLGGADSATSLGLTEPELDLITAGSLVIGNSNTGTVTFSDSITRAAPTNVLITAGPNRNIAFVGSGSLNPAGGNVNLATSGTSAITSGLATTDITNANAITLAAGSGGIGTSSNPLTLSGLLLSTSSANSDQHLSASGSITIGSVGLSAGTGAIELLGGTFVLGGSGRIADSTTLDINGATFDIGAFNETVARLILTSGSITGTTGVLTSTNTIQTKSGSAAAILAGTNGLTQSTAGTTTLSKNNTYSGPTTINDGTLALAGAFSNNIANSSPIEIHAAAQLDVTGLINGTLILAAGQTITGDGTVKGVLNAADDSTVSPGFGTGILRTDSDKFDFGSTFIVELNGLTAGTQHDQLSLTGTVRIENATLRLTGSLAVTPATLQSLTIIANDGSSDLVVGTFNGLPEGSPVPFPTTSPVSTLYITYRGGDGNDVVLNSQPIVNGATDADNFELTGDGAVFTLKAFDGLSNLVYTNTYTSPPNITINGLEGDDTLTVRFTAALPQAIPAGGVFFDGGVQSTIVGDRLRVVGHQTESATYTPNGVIDANDKDGVVAVNVNLAPFGSRDIVFTTIEPLDLESLLDANIRFPNDNETISLANGLTHVTGEPAIRVSGTSGALPAVPIEAVSLRDNTNVSIDTTTVDGADTIALSSATVDHGNINLSITTGAGSDSIEVNGTIMFPGAVNLSSQHIAFNNPGSLIATFDSVTLNAGNGSITDDSATTSVSALTLSATAAAGITLGTKVGDLSAAATSSGAAINIAEFDDISLKNVTTNDGAISVTAGGQITASLVDSKSANTHITAAAGSIVSSSADAEPAGTADILGNQITLQLNSPGSVIGGSAASRLELNANQLQILTSGNGNSAFVVDTGAGLTVTNSSLGTTSTFDLLVQNGNLTSVVDGVGDLRADNVTVEVTGSPSTIGAGIAAPLEVDATIILNATTAGGSIFLLDTGSDLPLGSITAGAGSVDLAANSGAITDANSAANNITATAAALRARDGIGSTNSLETDIGTLAATNATAGDVAIDNVRASGLIIGTVNGQVGVENLATGGSVRLTTTTSLTLPAGSRIAALGQIELGSTSTSSGSTFEIHGDLDALAAILNGSSLASALAGDTFNVTPDKDVADILTPITIRGNNPVSSPGDSLLLDNSGLPTATLTLGADPRSGIFSFGGAAANVRFESIESVATTPTAFYNVVLDMAVAGFDDGSDDTIVASRAGTEFVLVVNGAEHFRANASTVNSLTILGSNDNELFQIDEIAAGLPAFRDRAPAIDNTAEGGGTSSGSHLNATASSIGGVSLSNVTIHLDGGPGTNTLAARFSSPHTVQYTSDNLDSANSGNLAILNSTGSALQSALSFAHLASINLTTSATAGSSLVIDASGTPLTDTITIQGAGADATQASGNNGLAPATFGGFESLFVRSGSGADAITLTSLDSATTLTNITLDADNLANTDVSPDTLQVQSTGSAIFTVRLLGGQGNDAFIVSSATSTIDSIAGQIIISPTTGPGAIDDPAAGDVDSLQVADTLDTTGDNATITETTIEGLTGYAGAGADLVFANIDTANVTGTSSSDAFDIRLNPGSDLKNVTVSGHDGDDKFFLNLNTGTDANNAVAGLVNITLNGDAGSDSFGNTPSNSPLPPVGPPAPLPAPTFNVPAFPGAARGAIEHSSTTAIVINGGAEFDTFNLDFTPSYASPAATAVLSTIGGIASTTGYQNITFPAIEVINVVDGTWLTSGISILTRVQMGVLFVRGTENGDTIQFGATSNANVASLNVNGTSYNLAVTTNTLVHGRGGIDTIQQGSLAKPAEFYGGAGDDYLSGNNANDLLVGGADVDRLIGSGGDNELWGDNVGEQGLAVGGGDNISAGAGSDKIYGGGGNDSISASGGNDYVFGGAGSDTIDGGAGNDRLYGGADNDTITGYSGNDLLAGNDGNDRLYGQSGHDVILGGLGEDYITGDSENDLLFDGGVSFTGPTGSDVSASTVFEDANDLAMKLLTDDWTVNNPFNLELLIASLHDSDKDSLSGGLGDDKASPGPTDTGSWETTL